MKLPLLIALSAPVSSAAAPRAAQNAPLYSAPSVAITTQKVDWVDAKRARTVPATLHFPAQKLKPLPLLIISHGNGGTRDGLNYIGQFWASRGYICAQIQHAGSDASVWRGAEQPMEALKGSMANREAINARPLDVKFAIDEMLRLNLDAKSAFFGRINAAKIGVAGHSFGAFTAQASVGRAANLQPAWRDPRVCASIALSPPAQSGARAQNQYRSIKTPFYVLTGTRDELATGGTRAGDRRVPFDAITGAEGYLLILEGATHATFGGGNRAGRRGGGEPKDDWHHALIHASTLAFWDAYLKDSASAKTYLRGGEFGKHLSAEGRFEIK